MTQKNKLFFLFKCFADNDLGHYLAELLMLHFDIVGLLRFSMSGDDEEKLIQILKQVMADNDFVYLIKDGYIYIYKPGFELAEDKLHEPGYLGAKLGFPDCCIKNHMSATHRDQQIENIAIEPINDWRLNILYHQSIYHLIPHWPCSFNCQASLKMAADFWGRLKEFFPELIPSYLERLQGEFWHLYELGDKTKIKTKFANGLVFKLTGEKNAANEFSQPILHHDEIYNSNLDFENFLQELNSLDKLKLMDKAAISIKRNGQEKSLPLPDNFRQIDQFISFK